MIQQAIHAELDKINPLPGSLIVFHENYNRKWMAIAPVGVDDPWKLANGNAITVIGSHYIDNTIRNDNNTIIVMGGQERIIANSLLHFVSLK